MITIPISIQLPKLWGAQTFVKNDWGEINLIVGSNGTGKSLFAEQLKIALQTTGYKPRILNAERLTGFEKQDYSNFAGSNFTQGINIRHFGSLKQQGDQYGLSTSAFVILKERLDIRIKIEALLSDIFSKTIRFVEQGGYMIPKIQNTSLGEEYDLKQNECHGLKELITLLTFIYDDDKNCLILDEPELHLHPQFQSFLLSEIRGIAGDPKTDPSKKLFFIITHSPYFIDLKTIDDLKNILISQKGSQPTYIDELTTQDEFILKKFLPRFNTHHKQFFFSPNPVFVEGYTDQQIITLLFDKLDLKISAAGSCVIDVGGKDELGVFFNLCKKLKIECRVIADMDALLKGRLREIIKDDSLCNAYIQEIGVDINIDSAIGDLERRIKDIADDLLKQTTLDVDVVHLKNALSPIIDNGDKRHKVIRLTLLALQKFPEKIKTTLSTELIQTNVAYSLALFKNVLNALAASKVFLISVGEIEHFYTQTTVDYLNITDSDKNTGFHKERDHILSSTSPEDIKREYEDLLKILIPSVPQIKVDLSKHLKFQLIEWFQLVQRGISRGDFSDADGLKTNAKIEYNLYSQLFEVLELAVEDDKKFVCKIAIKPSISRDEKKLEFTEKTTAHDFKFSLLY